MKSAVVTRMPALQNMDNTHYTYNGHCRKYQPVRPSRFSLAGVRNSHGTREDRPTNETIPTVTVATMSSVVATACVTASEVRVRFALVRMTPIECAVLA